MHLLFVFPFVSFFFFFFFDYVTFYSFFSLNAILKYIVVLSVGYGQVWAGAERF